MFSNDRRSRNETTGSKMKLEIGGTRIPFTVNNKASRVGSNPIEITFVIILKLLYHSYPPFTYCLCFLHSEEPA